MAFNKRFFLLLIVFLHLFLAGVAQIQLPVDSAFSRAVDQKTRTLWGIPGLNYWQNKAIYNLKIGFNPRTRLLSGTAEIFYTNNSPDTLREIWFKLYPNIYKKGVLRKAKIGKKDLGEGIILDRVLFNGKEANERSIDGTNMSIPMEALAPGEELGSDARTPVGPWTSHLPSLCLPPSTERQQK